MNISQMVINDIMIKHFNASGFIVYDIDISTNILVSMKVLYKVIIS